MATNDTEHAIDEFLEDNPRAAQWHRLREALTDRLRALRQGRASEPDEARQKAMDTQIAALDKQVAALHTEEAVSQFVEDSIRVTLARAQPSEGEEEDY